MVDEPACGPPSGDGHVEGSDDQVRTQRPRHRPAHNPAAEDVDHGGQIEEALPGRQIGDVSHPQAVGCVGGEAALDQIGRESGIVITQGGLGRASMMDAF